MLRTRPRRVVYVSCHVPTQARDVKLLREGGYRLEACQPVDMFCYAGGVENVKFNELGEIELANGEIRKCKVLEVNGDTALVQLFESATGINLAESKVRFLGKSLDFGVSPDILGRVFDGMGNPTDGGPAIIPEK